MHLPVDGKPLSRSGYAFAQAEWKKCKQVPCNGGAVRRCVPDTGEIMLASLDPAQRTVSTINISAPMPMLRRPGGSSVVALDPNNNPFTRPRQPLQQPERPAFDGRPHGQDAEHDGGDPRHALVGRADRPRRPLDLRGSGPRTAHPDDAARQTS